MVTTQHILSTLPVGNTTYHYYNLELAGKAFNTDFSALPFCLKILLENLLRNSKEHEIRDQDITAFSDWLTHKKNPYEIDFYPARVLMQDFTGVPAVVDLAAMRDAMQALGGDPTKINPLTPVDLIIDHSVQVDFFGTKDSFRLNVEKEMERNIERYELLRSAQQIFSNFRTVPPGTGICHQVNLEYLGKVVWTNKHDDQIIAYPDTVVGTDSHTTMINGLAVLGWGVGGIEAESAMLGQPISMKIPDVIGFELTGQMIEGTTATDLVLTITQMLREKGVVDKFVEFYGPGLSALSLADRATIANMAPEYGATCGIFPIDKETLHYMELTGRNPQQIELVEAYAKKQGLWHDPEHKPIFTDVLYLDLGTITPCLAGPKRPQDKVPVETLSHNFDQTYQNTIATSMGHHFQVGAEPYTLSHGDVVIAAITSCTNTSNPYVMLAAGLLARNAIKAGLSVKPWVKTSLAPGSQVVTEYFKKSNLQDSLDQLGFSLVGYGCTTCIGNSGPLPDPIAQTIVDNNLMVASVLSGNRNFEGRVHPLTKANYLASPPLVVAYALAGTVRINLHSDPLAINKEGQPVYLKDIWPTNQEITEMVSKMVTPEMFRSRYQDVFTGDKIWQSIKTSESKTYQWSKTSTYIKNPPYFAGMTKNLPPLQDIKNANILAVFGDSITTDHISPAGNIAAHSPAGQYLKSRGVEEKDFNSYGSRRGNDDVMVRGTFANIRIRNEMTPEKEGGYTRHIPTGELLSIFDAAERYKQEQTPLVIIAGKDYGMGSSRDWAAKGTLLLGIKAVICESFERIHRSNLIGMGVLPLNFEHGVTRKTLELTGAETISLKGLTNLQPRCQVQATITNQDGSAQNVTLICRIETADELAYYENGGILHRVLRQLAVTS